MVLVYPKRGHNIDDKLRIRRKIKAFSENIRFLRKDFTLTYYFQIIRLIPGMIYGSLDDGGN